MIAASTKARGFTLIELLIILAIVAILIAIAVPNCQRYRERNAPCLREETRPVQVCVSDGAYGSRCHEEIETVCVERSAR